MRIINGRQLAYEPDGTVFSDIIDNHFNPNGNNGDMDINGLHIMCGHDEKYCPIDSGRFNGVLHMLGYVSCWKTEPDSKTDDDWRTLTDTDSNDYTEENWVVVWDKKEVQHIIDNLQWALNGCNRD